MSADDPNPSLMAIQLLSGELSKHENVAGAGLSAWCICGWSEDRDPWGCAMVDHEAAIALQWVAENLRSEQMVEAVARSVANLEPDEDWPTNEALGGGLTGTRDDEYRSALREQATDYLKVIREALGVGA